MGKPRASAPAVEGATADSTSGGRHGRKAAEVHVEALLEDLDPSVAQRGDRGREPRDGELIAGAAVSRTRIRSAVRDEGLDRLVVVDPDEPVRNEVRGTVPRRRVHVRAED